jgi:Ca2+-binding RTX toxin-like protein
VAFTDSFLYKNDQLDSLSSWLLRLLIFIGVISSIGISSILSIKYVTAENAIIGTQNTVKSPAGDMTFCHGNIIYPQTICRGSNQNDTIIAPVGGGTIYAFGGDDKIQGLLGSGVVYGMDGNDAIRGGNTSDVMFGNNGDDILAAGLGQNFLTGGGGSMLSGGEGNDLLIGGGGHDVFIGGPGHDKFDCKGASDLILDFNPEEDVASNNCIIAT